MASDLALSGYKVNLFELERFSDFNLKPKEEKDGIERDGMMPGLAMKDFLTSDIEESQDNANIVNETIHVFDNPEYM